VSAPPRWLFWHRRDLRLADNRGLVAALAATPAVTGYNTFSFDLTALLVARAGQTLRLRFAEVDNVNVFNFGVDDDVFDHWGLIVILQRAGERCSFRCWNLYGVTNEQPAILRTRDRALHEDQAARNIRPIRRRSGCHAHQAGDHQQ
jgi:hypothetical protein